MFRDDGDERSRVETVFPRPLEEYLDVCTLFAWLLNFTNVYYLE